MQPDWLSAPHSRNKCVAGVRTGPGEWNAMRPNPRHPDTTNAVCLFAANLTRCTNALTTCHPIIIKSENVVHVAMG